MLKLETNHNERTPLFQQIKQQLAEYIVSTRLEVDDPLPNVGKIASIAGVSVRTADQALLALVEEGICYRKPKRGTFVAKCSNVSNLVHRRIIGIDCPYQTDRLFEHQVENAVYIGIIDAGSKSGLTPFFISSGLHDNIRFYQQNRGTQLAGVILLAGDSVQNLSELRQYAPMPFILINYDIEAASHSPNNVYCIFNDDFLGGYQAAEHLINQGHRKFAVLSFKIGDDNYRHRVDGFLQAIRDRGLTFRPELLMCEENPEPTPDDVQNGTDLLEKSSAGGIVYPLLRGQIGLGARLCALARRAGDFTAALCVNDWLAFGAAQSQPGLAVSGYDHIMPEFSRIGGFPTIAIDFAGMGARAVKMLSEPLPEQRVTRILPRLIPRPQPIGVKA